MKQLFISEWQRLWNRKSTWISFMLIPIVLTAIVRRYVKTHALVTAFNFPSKVLGNESIVIFDVIVIVLIIMAVTSEYREGQLRMVMIRSVSFGDIFKAKYLVVLSTSFLLLAFNFIISTFLGYLFLPRQEIKFPYYSRKFTTSESILYNLKYYLIAFIILAAVISVIMCISVVCNTTIGTLAASLIFIFVSSILPDLCAVFVKQTSQIYKFMNYTFLTRIQYGGIETLLAERPQEVGLILTSIAFHIVVFYLMAFNLFSDQDCYN